MCEACGHITTYAKLNQADPTKTTVLRNNFVKDMDRRFNALKRLVYETVVKNDAFGLKNNIQLNTAAPRNSFAFTTTQEKVDSFMSWFNKQVDDGLLKTEYRMQLGEAGMKPWTNTYISDSYKRGIDRASYEGKKAKITGAKTVAQQGGIDAVMGLPLHADRLGMLYTRTFAELKGITGAMDSQISKVLAQGIADGDGPATIAAKINKTIEGGLDLTIKTKAGIERTIPAQVRARTLARTEIIRAHHTATIQEYKNWGLAGVKVQAEWSTAGDDRVCSECASLQGKVFTLNEIEGMIPVHPNCRCLALPTEPIEEKTTVKDSVKGIEETKASGKKSPAAKKTPKPAEPEILWQNKTQLKKGASQTGKEFEDIGLAGVRVEGSGASLPELNLVCNTIGNDVLGKLPTLKPLALDKKIAVYLNDASYFADSGTLKNALGFYHPPTHPVRGSVNFVNSVRYTQKRQSLSVGVNFERRLAKPWTVSSDMQTVVRHEYGHHIHLTVISEKNRILWDTFYKNKGNSYFFDNVSQYSQTNATEAFAETFAAYTSPLYQRGILPKELEELMESIIGKRIDL